MVFWKKRTGKKITPVRQGVRGGYWEKVFYGETRKYHTSSYSLVEVP